jgi:hypothetical protein
VGRREELLYLPTIIVHSDEIRVGFKKPVIYKKGENPIPKYNQYTKARNIGSID